MADLKLELTQVFDAPIEKVWDAWTNPESLKEWKSPEGMNCYGAEIDLKIGGEYRVQMKPEDNSGEKIAFAGKYSEIEKPRKLVYSWLWEGAPAETHTTTVTVLLKEIGKTKTEITLIHSGFVDKDMRHQHDLGWGSTLKKLDVFLSQKLF